MMELYKKMINEAMAAQKADVATIKANRGKDFKIADTKAYVDVANKMKAIDGQSQEVFDLHVNSVNAHFDTLSAITDTVRPEDDPFVEHYQTPVILEILCDADEAFRASLAKFIQAFEDNEALVGKEAVRRYGGFYGPTCVVDFALIPGSTSNVVNQILALTDIPEAHKKAILAAKSWAMNTSYGLGDVFANELEAGKTLDEAVKAEVAILKKIYETPVKGQTDLMADAGHTSFDVAKYMADYRTKMEKTVIAAKEAGVNYGNILTVPAYCVGDISHHISQSTYNMCKDDVIMGIIEATTDVIDSTLNNNIDKFTSPYEVLSLATGASATAVEYILELDGFNAPTVVELLTKRFHNFVQQFPTRGPAAELHNSDFMDMIHRGWGYLDKARKVRASKDINLSPMINKFKVDLDPVRNNEIIMNPQRYTYPACAITVRFSSLMRLADYPCLLTSEP
ncbi:MAG: DUF2193 family protein, partial [Methanobacteriaceae archaeon]